MKQKIYLIKKPDGEIYCAAASEERAWQIIGDDCFNGNLNFDGPMSPDDAEVEECYLWE